MSAPIFIMATAQEGMLLERDAVIALLERWTDEMERTNFDRQSAPLQFRRAAAAIRLGVHVDPKRAAKPFIVRAA